MNVCLQDLRGTLVYELGEEEYPAPYFFHVHNVTGEVFVTQPLANDYMRLTKYIIEVIAYDTAYPDRVSTTGIDIVGMSCRFFLEVHFGDDIMIFCGKA